MNHKRPFSLDGPESSTEWVVGKGIAIYFIPAVTLLIPHYGAFEPEVLGEAGGCFADPAFLCL